MMLGQFLSRVTTDPDVFTGNVNYLQMGGPSALSKLIESFREKGASV